MDGASVIDREDPVALDRIFTLPNGISVARLGLLAWSLVLLFGDDARVRAAIVLAVAGATDFLDGYLARRFHQVSTLGKLLDPTVDVAVLASAVIAVAVYGGAPWWLAGVVLARELFIVTTGVVLGVLGARRIDVVYIGKVATFGFMATFPGLLLGDGPGTAAHALRIIAWVIAYPSLCCSVAAIFVYMPVARVALDAGRADRLAHSA